MKARRLDHSESGADQVLLHGLKDFGRHRRLAETLVNPVSQDDVELSLPRFDPGSGQQHVLANAASLRFVAGGVSVSAPAFDTVEACFDAATIDEAWAELETTTPCSIYQTRGWLQPWIATLGQKAGLTPLFVLARRADRRPVILLCLGIVRWGPFRIATWLGGSDSNFNMPLARPDVEWTRAEVQRLFREAARACGHARPDVFGLLNQPFAWDAKANPLVQLAHQRSPSPAFGTTLQTNAEALFESRFSKSTRKKLRKKETKLAALGDIRHLVVETAEDQKRVIDQFIAQKIERLRAKKIVSNFKSPVMRAFIEAASPPNGTGLELHALLAGSRIVAVYGGGAHNGQWSGMFNSIDLDEDVCKSSPGDLLLLRIIRKACAEGLTRFDLGIGAARYKASLCDECLPLFDALVPISLRGHIAANLIGLRQSSKRWIKTSPRLHRLATTISGSWRA